MSSEHYEPNGVLLKPGEQSKAVNNVLEVLQRVSLEEKRRYAFDLIARNIVDIKAEKQTMVQQPNFQLRNGIQCWM